MAKVIHIMIDEEIENSTRIRVQATIFNEPHLRIYFGHLDSTSHSFYNSKVRAISKKTTLKT